jgi:YVTN family beta-propeller protein
MIPIILCLLVFISYIMVNNEAEAQLSENMLESIADQTKVLTSAQIEVGGMPIEIFSSVDATYVANFRSNTVSVIDSDTNTVIKNIHVRDGPRFIEALTGGSAVYVANFRSNTVSVIDSDTNTVVKNITVGDRPRFVEALAGEAIYVANSGSNTVSVINPANNTVIKNIEVGANPSSIHRYGNTIFIANSDSNTVSVINPANNTVIKNITVGAYPISITTSMNAVYVANSESNTVSVINPANNTVIKNITVGASPGSIYGFGDTIYVANGESNTVSVINQANNTVIKNIEVGANPGSIYGFGDTIYVANSDSNTISVINPANNTVIKNIEVGANPGSIYGFGDTIYVANSDSNTISVIYPVSNEVVAGVTFNISPFEGGQIICDGLDTPINLYFYVSSGTECMGKPNNGYEFASWVETFEGNSTRTINASTQADSPLAALSDAFTNDPAASLTVNRFGNFTAYFKALPPPVPAAYWASLFTVVVTALVGSLLIPAAVGWFKTKKQTSRLNSFHQQMPLVSGDRKLDNKITNQLNILNRNISNSYAAGKISNEQFMSLKNELSIAYQEIFKNRIESTTDQDLETVNKIRIDLIDANSNGKLSNEHSTNLKNEISVAYREIFKKRIESISNTDTDAVHRIKNDITDAYSTGKISELHYTLLSGQISDILNHK